MTIRVLSRPITYLTLAYLTTLAQTHSLAADEQASTEVRSKTEFSVDPHLLPALLPPMSRLIPSPYSDLNAINNPLGVDQISYAKMAVIKTVTSQPETNKQESFETDSEANARMPQARDFTISEPLSPSAQNNTPRTFRSLAIRN